MRLDEIDDDDLRTETPEVQREVMEDWFRERFEDPADRTPYESAEGGYIWIWGGPYEAEWELRSRFEGVVPDEVIEQLASDLSDECAEWAPTASSDDYDEGDFYDAVRSNTDAGTTLNGALKTIRELLSTSIPTEHAPAFRRMLYANGITALETFLSDTFINRVLQNDELVDAYISSEPNLKNRKISFRNIRREAAQLEITVRRELLDTVWHNLGKVKRMYGAILKIDIGDLASLANAVHRRHDIVHRNGRQKDGDLCLISESDIIALLADVEAMATRIQESLAEAVAPDEGDSGNEPF